MRNSFRDEALHCKVLLIIAFFAFAAVPASSQDLDDVTIAGRVTDSNKQAIGGASVTVTHFDSGIARTGTTDMDGRFRFIELRPGIYRVKVESAGFAAQEKTDLQTVSGQNVQLDFTLLPAGVKAETTVTAGAEDTPPVDTTRTIVGGTITEREIEELPNNSRNPLELVLTLGGTTEEQLSTSGLAEDRNASPSTAPLEQGNFSLSGGTAYSNNITIDGLDNNDDRSSRERFQPSLESVAEVQVIQNQFSSEYGRASGGRINLRTRAGTNRFRGRFFMFFRDDNLNANSWYNNSRSLPRLPLTQYNPGFSLSGPVRVPFYNGKSRTFFSFTYEYDNLLDTTFINTWVPVGSNPRYTLPTGNAACPATITCVDNASSPATPIAPYQVLYDTPNRNHIVVARVDHRLASNNDLTVGYQFGRRKNRRTTGASTTRLDDALQARNSKTDAINFTNNHVFSSKAVNQFRTQYSIFEPSFETDNPFDPVVLIGYRNPETSANQTLIAGNSTAAITGDATGFPQNRRETRYQVQDSVTYIAGSHTLKFGVDVQHVRSKALALGDATGTFNFPNILGYQSNTLSRYRQNFGTRADAVNTYWGAFVNDEVRPREGWTVSYGVRYERETAVSDNNNWGPRIGIAWDPFKSGRGVIRFGAGIFYNRVLLRTVADSIQNNGGSLVSFDTNTIGTSGTDSRRLAILAALANRFPGTYSDINELRSLVAAACSTVVNPLGPCTSGTGFSSNISSAGNPLRSVEPGLRIPESYQFNVGFEREVAKGWVLEANFTWNKTAFLWRDSNPNAPRLPTGFSDWTAYLLANPFVLSPTRIYTFYLGSPTDPTGLATAQNGTTTCTTTTPNCFVNLNTLNASSTAPAVAVIGQNNNATGAPLGIALAAIGRFRPDPTVEETSRIGSNGNALYRGLILEFRRSYRKLGYGFGTSMRAVYTLSSSKDDGLNNTANAEINGDFAREWARSLQDRRHRFSLTGTLDTPWWFGRLRFSPLMRLGSSAPFNVSAGGSDRNLDDVSTDRLNFSGNIRDIRWRRPGSPVPETLLSQFSLQPIGAKSGNLPRNAGTGPALFLFDLSVSREWKFRERFRLRPVLEFGNILNSVVFSYGAEFINFTALSSTPSAAQQLARQNFLVPTRTYRPRDIRVGLRFDF